MTELEDLKYAQITCYSAGRIHRWQHRAASNVGQSPYGVCRNLVRSQLRDANAFATVNHH